MKPHVRLVACALFVAAATPAAGATRYTAVDLGSRGAANSLGPDGRVCGYATFGAEPPFTNMALTTGSEGQAARILAGFGGTFSECRGVNASGRAVGDSNLVGDQVSHAFASRPGGVKLVDLGTLGGPTSTASAVNDRGEIVGAADLADGSQHAWYLDRVGGSFRDLGTLGGSGSYAYGVNASGQVVGQAVTSDGVFFHAFITGPRGSGGLVDLGTLGGRFSTALAVNDAGRVVGGSEMLDGSSHAFITGPDGQGMVDLGLGGGISAALHAVNRAGLAVGHIMKDFTVVAAVTDGTQPVRPLAPLVDLPAGVTLLEATGVDDDGEIIANGSDQHVYLLVPIRRSGQVFRCINGSR